MPSLAPVDDGSDAEAKSDTTTEVIPSTDFGSLCAAYNEDSDVRLIIDHFAGRQRNQNTTEIEALLEALIRAGTPSEKSALIHAFRRLDALGIGRFVAGRRGYPGRQRPPDSASKGHRVCFSTGFLAMIRKDLGYTYFPSLPTITIFEGMPDSPHALGFLQSQVGRRFEGELAFSGGCWTHLSLEESEDGSTLSGTARINTKISTRECRSSLAKEFKKGVPFKYALIRLK